MNGGNVRSWLRSLVLSSFRRTPVDQDPRELFRERLIFACVLGAVMLPGYFGLDWYVSSGQLSRGVILSFLGARVLLGLGMGVVALALYRGVIPGRYVYATDTIVFTSVGLVCTYIIAATWHLVPDYYVGLGQMMMVRCVIVPGGIRRALPSCLGLAAALPVGLALFSLFSRGDLAMVTDDLDRLMLACSGLGGFLAVGVVGSAIYHLMMGRELRALHFGRYRIESVIARGGMGIVYRVRDRELGRTCAMKVISADKVGDVAAARELFEKEARHTSQLTDANIIEIHDFGETVNGDLFYVMEYLRGLDVQNLVLEKVKQEGNPLDASRVIHLVRQACNALNGAHRLGLIHRDIKPANLFVTQREGNPDFVKVLDFGVVKVLSGHALGESELAQRIRTLAEDDTWQDQVSRIEDDVTNGEFKGTPAYAAPEQIERGASSPQGDIYALGGVMYYMLTGQRPYAGNTGLALMFLKLKRPPRRPSVVRPDLVIPSDLEGVVMRCLANQPADRYASMEDLREALDACRDAVGWDLRESTEFWSTLTIEREQVFSTLESMDAADDAAPGDTDEDSSGISVTRPPLGVTATTGGDEATAPPRARPGPLPAERRLSLTSDPDETDELDDAAPPHGTDVARDMEDTTPPNRPPWKIPTDGEEG